MSKKNWNWCVIFFIDSKADAVMLSKQYTACGIGAYLTGLSVHTFHIYLIIIFTCFHEFQVDNPNKSPVSFSKCIYVLGTSHSLPALLTYGHAVIHCLPTHFHTSNKTVPTIWLTFVMSEWKMLRANVPCLILVVILLHIVIKEKSAL